MTGKTGLARAPQQAQWLRVGSVGVAGFFSFLDVYVTQPILPLLARQFATTVLAVSLTVSAATLAVALAAPLVGTMAERIGRKRLIVASLFALAVPTFLAAQAPGLAGLVRWRFVQGLLVPGAFVVTIAYITEEWPAAQASFPMGVYVTGTVLGGVSGRLLGGFIAATWGWRSAFVLLAAMTLVGAALVWRLLPSSRRFVRQGNLRAALGALAHHLRNRRLLATFAIGFNLLFMLVAALTYVSFYLSRPPFRLGAAALGTIYLVYLPSLLVLPAAGAWTGRVGHRRALVVALLATGGGVLLTLWPHLAPILVGLVFCSGGLFVGQMAATSYLGAEAEAARSSAAGLYAGLYYIGGSLGGVMPGLMWGRFHWPGCVALVIASDLAALGLSWRFWRPGVHGPVLPEPA